MSYYPLEKLSYSNHDQYEKVYEDRFSSESAIHLNFNISDYPAFFLMTPEVVSLVAAIYKADKSVSTLKKTLPGVAIQQFTSSALVEEILLTNDIEGVYSTRREIADVLESLRQEDRSKRFYGLVQKYDMLQTYGEIPLQSPQDIRTVYDELVLAEVREDSAQNVPDGEIFRKEEVSVYSKTQKEIHRGLYPESHIISAMEKALDFLNNEDIQAMLRIAIFHYLFGYIHPFYDGNGRTSRFISSYLLSRELDALSGYRLSYTIKESIGEYYKAFKLCNSPRNRGDLTPFLLTFLRLIARSMEQLVAALEKRRQRYLYYLQACKEAFFLDSNEKMLDVFDLLIQASLFSSQGITVEELCAMLRISRNTLSNRLKEISPETLLDVQVEGHRKYYSLDLSELDKIITTER